MNITVFTNHDEVLVKCECIMGMAYDKMAKLVESAHFYRIEYLLPHMDVLA